MECRYIEEGVEINDDNTMETNIVENKDIIISSDEVAITKSDFEIVSNEKSGLLLGKKIPHNGLSWKLAIFFIVGEVSGGSVVSIGYGLVNAGCEVHFSSWIALIIGWFGMVLFLISLYSNMYMGTIHSKSMVHVASNNGTLLQTRTPYNGIIEYALGRKAKIFSIIMLNMFTICTSTIFLLISAELLIIVIKDFIPHFNEDEGFRILLVIFVLCLIPLSWLGTPKEYWGVALIATLSTAFAAALLSYIIWSDNTKDFKTLPKLQITVLSFFKSVGIIIFAFSGIPMFPNIQNDVKNQKEFSKSICCGYSLMALIYLPVGLAAFFVLRGETKGNIVYNIFTLHNADSPHSYEVHKVLCYTILILLAGHLIFAYNLVFNTTAQEAEEYFRVPRGFTWQRCVIRTSLVLFTLFLAEAIPDFSIIISIVGGIIQVILSYILPAAAYVKLKSNLHWRTKLGMSFCVILAIIAIVMTTYAGVKDIISLYS